MDSKQLWMHVGISLIVAIVVSVVVTVLLTGNAALAPPEYDKLRQRSDLTADSLDSDSPDEPTNGGGGEPGPGDSCTTCTNAEACSADGVCETESLLIEDETGQGQAYACITGDGRIFRSYVKCSTLWSNACEQFELESNEIVTGNALELLIDQGEEITFMEGEQISEDELVAVIGYVVEVDEIINRTGAGSNTYSEDEVILRNAIDSSQTWEAQITGEGLGTIDIGAYTYGLRYVDDRLDLGTEYIVLDYPGSGTGDTIDLSLCF